MNLLNSNCTIDYFEAFLSNEVINDILIETNRYAHLKKQSKIYLKSFKEVTINEFYIFIALNLLMGQIRKHKISDYWSTDFILQTPIFNQCISRNRFNEILRTLHFSNDEEKNDQSHTLFKIETLYNYINNSFSASFYPFKNLVIDESLLLFKGRLRFRQYIPSKRHRFGIKFFIICDCKTGYILKFLIYTGATTKIANTYNVGISGNTVFTMLEKYFHKGHSLYVDNWYASPRLFQILHNHFKINCCGTVKANRKHMPNLKNVKLKRNEVVAFKTDTLLAIKWLDKREVYMLTTFHNLKFINVKNKNNVIRNKPACVVDYNKNMGAVDKTDMLLSSTECVRKNIKWYKKVFFHIIDLSVLNAHVLYKLNNKSNIPLVDFIYKLIKDILTKYPTNKLRAVRNMQVDSPLRLTGRHFADLIPSIEGEKRPPSKRCHVCTIKKHRKETRYMCLLCNVPLCIVPCFKNFHDKVRFDM